MAKSILQVDRDRCYLCGRYACGDHLDKHHVFGAALRDKSEYYGLTVYIHHNECHIYGTNAVHRDAAVDAQLKEEAQRAAMATYGWSVDDFREYFYKNWLRGED